ncbi:alanine:cation symporter family protein [Peptacetobacter hominis]|uniref:Alanine:cation symporter family protein n=1 Tax=Peptacetobacter hominis TaxID=2743610 RepID=A0A544QXA3_9FIRM|nr:alanine/glycine:cation symporter family protein [Peptacetobacter hominis]TQQ85301.1 alanine:cation symporter family protein [Peptacetobacter hominis]
MIAQIHGFIGVMNNYLWSYILIIMLVVLGIYFSIRTKFVQFRYFTEMFKLLTDGNANKNAKKNGKISSFQAFCISTSSRVGTGNIAGIALAIAGGGPGAIFWMWVMALIGSASSFVESTLAQIYKVKNGTAYKGGPAYYIEQGLNMRWLGIIFTILISITYGFVFNSVQSNTLSIAFNNVFGVSYLVIGIVLAALTAAVIFGGVHRVAKVSEIIVPVFAGLYILVAIGIVIMNIGSVPALIADIVKSAFKPSEMIMGTGAGFMTVLLTGVKRGLFSNEAGMGSAPNAAATAEVSHPVKQGLIQSLGVFTDTIIICSCTAFMVLLYNGYATSSNEGIALAQEALSSHIGSFGGIFIAICIFLFAFSSIVGNYYYGESNIQFVTESKGALNIYRALVCGMVLFGAVAKVQFVWDMADLFMAFMAIINMIVIAKLGKFAYIALDDYTKQKKAGVKDPIFYVDDIEGLENVEYWHKDK